MCLLMQDNKHRINVTDTVQVHLHNGSTILGVVKKMPSWFSKDWIILSSGSILYIRDYNHIQLLKKARTNINL